MGKVVLVTGASAGIGEACAWRFAEKGCKLILLARREERLEALRAELEAAYPGVRAHLVALDVREWGKMEQLVKNLPEEFSSVDILVNNAGLALGTSPGHLQDFEDMRAMIDTNVTSLMFMTRLIVPGMVERGSGHVVNISSIAAKEAYAGGAVYCSSKHAVHAFSDALRHDLVSSPVRVTTISPGLVKTEFSLVRFKGDSELAEAPYAGTDPLLAQDVADSVLYACTRPAHVQVADLLVLATYQAAAKAIARPYLTQ